MRLEELLDVDHLSAMIREGYVSERRHPSEPLTVLNYTAACQYGRVWNDVTRQCRGLIYRSVMGEEPYGEVVARPWPKFYNYGEYVEGGQGDPDAASGQGGTSHPAALPSLDLDAVVEVSDKLDGSLGILYPVREGQWAVATRGSFDSDQARWASKTWRDRYSDIAPQQGWTFLFEVVYPANRIVVDYGGMADLVLLGSVSIATGQVRGPAEAGWPGRRAEVFPEATLRAALEREPRANAEGLVVRFLDSGLMLKLKQDDYVELHRIVTGLSERTVWERLGPGGEDVDGICEGLPDEIQGWVKGVAAELQLRADQVYAEADYTHQEILRQVIQGWASISPEADDREWRAAYAEHVKRYPHLAPYLFLLFDDRDPRPNIWRSIKPQTDQR